MLIAIALTGILVAALATAFVVSARTFTSARDLVDDAGRAQVATSRFLGDAISAEQVRASQACGSDGTGFLRGFTWNIGPDDDLSTAVYADWYLDDDTVGDTTVTVVIRRLCGSATSDPHAVLRAVTSASIDCSGRTCTLSWATDRGDGEMVAYRRVDGP